MAYDHLEIEARWQRCWRSPPTLIGSPRSVARSC